LKHLLNTQATQRLIPCLLCVRDCAGWLLAMSPSQIRHSTGESDQRESRYECDE
jgi:hypothetical protein